LVIIAFPCNQFGAQEPKSNAQIAEFCKRRGFDGAVMKKCKVNGFGASPVFDFLKVKSKSGGIMWNFYKYVVAPDGRQVTRFTTAATPNAMVAHIAATIAKWDEANK
jgi:glutathione peroxidase